jgi:hypothetical protein
VCNEKYGTRSKLSCGWCDEIVHLWCASVQTKTKFAMCFTCHEEASHSHDEEAQTYTQTYT